MANQILMHHNLSDKHQIRDYMELYFEKIFGLAPDSFFMVQPVQVYICIHPSPPYIQPAQGNYRFYESYSSLSQ